jgi:AcrR family transcriptional regulator
MAPRVIPSGRFAAVVDAAAQVFIAHGYQRAQMQDVADAAGLGKGTLYGYARSKEALFAATVQYADGHEPLPAPGDLPVPPPAPGETAGLIAARLTAAITDLKLTAALTGAAAGASTPGPAELGAVVTDLYQRLSEHRTAIKLVDRCAPELPELAQLWFGGGRQAVGAALAEYLTRGQDAGALTLPGPAPLVARTVIEMCTLWAVHCHFDPGQPATAADQIDAAAVAAMLATLISRATTPPTTPPRAPTAAPSAP